MNLRAGAILIAACSTMLVAPRVHVSAVGPPDPLPSVDIPYESAVAAGREADDIAASITAAGGVWFILNYVDVNTELSTEDATTQWTQALTLLSEWAALPDKGASRPAVRMRVDKLTGDARDPSLYDCLIYVDGTRLSTALSEAAADGGGSQQSDQSTWTSMTSDMAANSKPTENLLPLTFGYPSGWSRNSGLFDPACIRDEAVSRLNALLAEAPDIEGVYIANKYGQQVNVCYDPGGTSCFDGKPYGTYGEQGKEWKSTTYVDGQFMPSELPPAPWYGLQIALAQAVVDAGLVLILDECCGYRGAGGAPEPGVFMPGAIRDVAYQINGISPSTVYVPIADAGADITDGSVGVAYNLDAVGCHNSASHTLACAAGPDCPGSSVNAGPSGRPQDGPASFTCGTAGTYTLTLTCEPGGSQDVDTVDFTCS